MNEVLCNLEDLKKLLKDNYGDEVADIANSDFHIMCKLASLEQDPLDKLKDLPDGGTDLDLTAVLEFIAHAAKIGAFLLAFYQHRRNIRKDRIIEEILKKNKKYNKEILTKIEIKLTKNIKKNK